MDEKKRIEQLRAVINHHMDLYYTQDAPEISDYEYDQLMTELKELEKKHPDWITPDSPTQKVGGTAKREAGIEVRHNVPMLSIQDVFSKEDVISWVHEVRDRFPDASFSVEEKIDGLSMSLRYQNGRLILAETRGDGMIGEDVTANARVIPDIKQTLPVSGYLELRGEVYMTLTDFDRYNRDREDQGKKPAANARNLAAGTLRQLDAGVVRQRGLHMLVFNVQDASDENRQFMHLQTDGLDALAAMGIPVVHHKYCLTDEEILGEIDRIGESRGMLDHDLDGAVVKINQIGYRSAFPAGTKYSAGHIAYKYPPEEKEVEIETISLDVGRTGKITFRAIFKEPVRLCGTSVQRATLHNIDFIQSMGIDEGCRAICRKQGEIIPAIVKVTKGTGKTYQAPAYCPKCGHRLVREADTSDIYCVNPSCPAQLKRTITYFAGRDAMNIKSFGKVYVEKLVDLGYLKNYADIYHLRDYREELIEKGLIGKEKNTDKILQAIENSKNNDASLLLTGLAIRNVGRRSAETIMQYFGSIRDLAEADVQQLTEIPDVGEVTARAIVDFFSDQDNRKILKRLEDAGVNMRSLRHREQSDTLAGVTIVVTGTLPSLSRSQAKALIEENGGKCTGSVSKRTDYLLAGENPGSKLEKARALGIPVISEAELLKMTGGHSKGDTE